MTNEAYWKALLPRHSAFVQIFALQKWVQSFLAEPPPASQQAQLRLKKMEAAQALVERVDRYMVQCDLAGKAPEQAVLADFAAQTQRL